MYFTMHALHAENQLDVRLVRKTEEADTTRIAVGIGDDVVVYMDAHEAAVLVAAIESLFDDLADELRRYHEQNPTLFDQEQ